MAFLSLKDALVPARANCYAVGAFNTMDYTFTEGIITAAEQTEKPVILMLADYFFGMEGMDAFYDFNVARIKASKANIVYHLDHGKSFEAVMKAIHVGCNSVMFDGSQLPLDENIEKTRDIVRIAHAAGVQVEAEIGHVAAPEGNPEGSVAKSEFFTDPDDAERFAKETGVDALAVAVGTVHGVYKGTPKLDYERLVEIRKRVGIPLVMHGGSGLPEDDFKKAVQNGMSKINFFTGMMMEGVSAMYEMLKEKDGRVRYLNLQQKLQSVICERVKQQMEVFGTPTIR
ncbi:MAG: class II fructose-bisphosphate aldolase [Oscillospiraceae bacterium]|nr:class II fructose-bisphosphate aldolase [Oscillospiraceae bacterium]